MCTSFLWIFHSLTNQWQAADHIELQLHISSGTATNGQDVIEKPELECLAVTVDFPGKKKSDTIKNVLYNLLRHKLSKTLVQTFEAFYSRFGLMS